MKRTTARIAITLSGDSAEEYLLLIDKKYFIKHALVVFRKDPNLRKFFFKDAVRTKEENVLAQPNPDLNTEVATVAVEAETKKKHVGWK